jgi:hypothetical protein
MIYEGLEDFEQLQLRKDKSQWEISHRTTDAANRLLC